MFKQYDKVLAAVGITEFDVSGEDDQTVVIQPSTPGIVEEVYEEDLVLYYVNFRLFGGVYVRPDQIKPVPTVTHVAWRNGTIFDDLWTGKRKARGGFRKGYRCEVLETRPDPVTGEVCYRIALHDGSFSELPYDGDLWVRAKDWNKLKPGLS